MAPEQLLYEGLGGIDFDHIMASEDTFDEAFVVRFFVSRVQILPPLNFSRTKCELNEPMMPPAVRCRRRPRPTAGARSRCLEIGAPSEATCHRGPAESDARRRGRQM